MFDFQDDMLHRGKTSSIALDFPLPLGPASRNVFLTISNLRFNIGVKAPVWYLYLLKWHDGQ